MFRYASDGGAKANIAAQPLVVASDASICKRRLAGADIVSAKRRYKICKSAVYA
jgi:hypothetical protein